MRKWFLIIPIVFFVVLLTSCSIDKLEVKDRIIAPTNNIPPLQGKWVIEKILDNPNKKESLGEEPETLMDKEALFHDQVVIIGGKSILDPSYKMKNVNISDYLLYKLKVNSEELGIEQKEAQVITIVGNDQYFYEFIKFNDKEMVLFHEDRFYFLKKTIEQVSREEINRYINVEKNVSGNAKLEALDSLSSGVLLGIKTYNYDEVDQVEEWNYKTLWIKTNDRSIVSAYEINDLLLPRKKGFWLIDVIRENNNGTFIDKINANPQLIFKDKEKMESSASYFMKEGMMKSAVNANPSILKSISYIGNDYISAEVIDKSNNQRKLEVYPIDYLEKQKPIMISDIVGETGLKVFRDGASGILKTDPSLVLDEESFGIVRRNGYWIMKGRVNYQLDGMELYKDYNIKTIPPKELVNYDDLAIPWGKIKAKVPNALDAFTSPDEDIIIIETGNSILIYSIYDNEISQQELGKIKKDSYDTIIMAEWSTGRYTNLWEEELLRKNAEIVKYK